MKKTAIIILAAGGSSRMKKPKQLLVARGQTLLGRTIAAAVRVDIGPVAVILGAHAEMIKKQIDFQSASIVFNLDWAQGISTSIRTGINYYNKMQSQLTGVILMVADQPKIDHLILKEMNDLHISSGAKLITCQYHQGIGTPCFFDFSFYPALMKLRGDQGAKSILLQNQNILKSIEFPLGHFDVDSPEDYNTWLKQ